MSPCGAVEMPLRYMVPTMGSAPRSSSRLTSSKLPVHEKRLQTHNRIKLEQEAEKDEANHLFCMPASICLYCYSPPEKYASEVISQPVITLTGAAAYRAEQVDGRKRRGATLMVPAAAASCSGVSV